MPLHPNEQQLRSYSSQRLLDELRRRGDDLEKAAANRSADITTIGQQRDSLLDFVNEAIDAAFNGCGLDGAWIQERCIDLGLLEEVDYDPEAHNVDCEALEPGFPIYVRPDWMDRGKGDES